MELTPKQQILELVNKSNKILVLTHVNPDGDALGSILALSLGLRKLGKDITMVCQDQIPNALSFLPENKEIRADLAGFGNLIISIDTTEVKVDKLGYKQKNDENRLEIMITPKSGVLRENQVKVMSSGAKFDLIFVLDSPEIDRVGKIYDENPDVFYETPIINIDHHSGNNYFGKVNWVELTATSTAEILVSLLESLGRDKPLFDSEVATALLTGIITDTGSFQHNNTTPKSFTVAAQLVAAGARQQEIIQHIYKTKPLSTLKLWGKILTEIHEEKKHRFVWSTALANDFVEFGANETETQGVVDELLKTVPEIDFAMLFSEKNGALNVSLRGVGKGVNVSEIARMFGGGGHELAAAFQLAGNTFDNEKDNILIRIKEYQAKRLGFLTDQLITNRDEDFNQTDFNDVNEQSDEVSLEDIDVT
jgi:phosphoesterase RecJ-like protein